MERYFTTIALLGVDEGNLPVHRYVQMKPMFLICVFDIQRYEIKEI